MGDANELRARLAPLGQRSALPAVATALAAVLALTGCDGQSEHALLTFEAEREGGAPTGAVRGSVIATDDGCVLVRDPDGTEWVPVFDERLEIAVTDGNLTVQGEAVAPLNGASQEIQFGGGQMTSEQVAEEASGPIDADCYQGPAWRVVSVAGHELDG